MDPTKRHLTPATMTQHQHHPLRHLQHQLMLLTALKLDKMIYVRLLANHHAVGSNLVSRQLAVLTRSTAPTHLHGLKAVSASAHLHHQHHLLRHQHHPLRHLQQFLHALKLERQCCARLHANQHVVGSNLVSRQLAVLTTSTAPTHLHGLKAVSASAEFQVSSLYPLRYESFLLLRTQVSDATNPFETNMLLKTRIRWQHHN
jgi:hypothetical protein